MKKLLLTLTTAIVPITTITTVVSCSPDAEDLFFRNAEVIEEVTDLLKSIPKSQTLKEFKNDIEDTLNQYLETKNLTNKMKEFYVDDLYWVYTNNSKNKITQDSFVQQDFSTVNYVVKVDFEEKDGLEWESETEEFSIYNTSIKYEENRLHFDNALNTVDQRYEYETNESLFELKQEIVEEFSEQLATEFKDSNETAYNLMSGDFIADYHLKVEIEGIESVKDIDTSKRYDVKFLSGTAVDFGDNDFILEEVKFKKDN
ncbi:hypothetical protein [Spiroplasma culicicola]|uniref:Lipoprotein n=1 Tax=Spiroplasma culicicola AES-1 TaxID=1276246 RepID=W6A730_9MOLU|nr:hypothetical protein [Spiroplasma culicicola]AHI52792.1 hypothetical protein SCULI_v1c04510 [Spiroplasma culicicola AES-1]